MYDRTSSRILCVLASILLLLQFACDDACAQQPDRVDSVEGTAGMQKAVLTAVEEGFETHQASYQQLRDSIDAMGRSIHDLEALMQTPDRANPLRSPNDETNQTPERQVTSPSSEVPFAPAISPGGHTMTEIWFSLAVLGFGLVIVLLEVLIVWLKKRGPSWDDNSFKLVGLTLVLIAGMFLIVAGYSQNQIAGMMGLLGTVAGYLLGKERFRSPKPATVSK